MTRRCDTCQAWQGAAGAETGRCDAKFSAFFDMLTRAGKSDCMSYSKRYVPLRQQGNSA